MSVGRPLAVFPIPQETVNREVDFFSDFSWRELGVGEGHNRAATPANHITNYLLELRARPELYAGDPRLSAAYQGGVFVGTVLLRRQVRRLGVKNDDCFLTTSDRLSHIDWPGMVASRFLLSQFIEGEFDPKPASLQLDSAWNMQTRMELERMDQVDGITPLGDIYPRDPLEEQMIITGVGDILASFADLNQGSVSLPFRTVPLAVETQDNGTLASS